MATSLPLTIAALALTGVGTGLYLGKSAIAEIDPSYFSSPYSEPSRFYADMVPGGARFESPQPQLADASLAQGLGNGCVLCQAAAEQYAYVVPDYGAAFDDYSESYSSYVSFEPDEALSEAEEEVAKAARLAALREVERYAHPDRAEPAKVRYAQVTVPEPEAAEPVGEVPVSSETTPGI